MKIKKLTAFFTVVLIMAECTLSSRAFAYDTKTADVSVRDPFILSYGDAYYMYGTGLGGFGYGCRVSTDLVSWSQPVQVFDASTLPDAAGDFWAPECHYYNGAFYLFATYRSAATGKRGTGVFRADDPLGPFTLISDGAVTPHEKHCIDGTLYVDDNGDPWIVYVGEWVDAPNGNGTMELCRLSDDLTRRVGESAVLFSARSALWAVDGVTDGPFLYRTSGGVLMMIWSNFTDRGYAVGMAYSTTGAIDGKWRQLPFTLYGGNVPEAVDGGHGMIFTAKDGKDYFVIHSPNGPGEGDHSKPLIFGVNDLGYTLGLDRGEIKNPFTRFAYKFTQTVNAALVFLGTAFNRAC